MINGTPEAKEVKGLRVVFYGYLAELAEAHLQTGSRIYVEGHIQMRRTPNGSIAFEIVAEDVEFLRNITWERGQKRLDEMSASGRGRPEKSSFTSLLPDIADALAETNI
jgi:single-stranded DNA-binding protein